MAGCKENYKVILKNKHVKLDFMTKHLDFTQMRYTYVMQSFQYLHFIPSIYDFFFTSCCSNICAFPFFKIKQWSDQNVKKKTLPVRKKRKLFCIVLIHPLSK